MPSAYQHGCMRKVLKASYTIKISKDNLLGVKKGCPVRMCGSATSRGNGRHNYPHQLLVRMGDLAPGFFEVGLDSWKSSVRSRREEDGVATQPLTVH